MDTKALKAHLEWRKHQLDALIKTLENRGESHPQYHQLNSCKAEYQTVISQLNKLKSMM